MRISSYQLNQQGINRILEMTQQTAKTQQQLATGRRITTAADDPVAAVRINSINEEISLREQFRSTIGLAQSDLKLEESTLDHMVQVLQRVRELTVQSGNAINTAEDRQFISVEIQSRFDELMSLMNTRLASGDYMFAGFRGEDQPFVRDATGAIVYQGDEGQRVVQIDASTSVTVSDSGKRLFVDVPSTNTTVVIRHHPNNDQTNSGAISRGTVVDQEVLDAFYPDDFVIQFEPLLNGAVSGYNYSVRRVSDNRVLLDLANVPFDVGDKIEVAGMEFEILGAPRPGDRFIVETSRTQDVLTTVERIATGLRTLGTTDGQRDIFNALVAETLDNVDNAVTSILEVRARIGAQLGITESVDFLHQEIELISKEMLSKLRDVDYAEAVSTLTYQVFVLEAAQKSFALISRLSLFNSL